MLLFDHSTFGHRRGIGRQRKRPGDGQPEWMQWELERSRFEHRKLANAERNEQRQWRRYMACGAIVRPQSQHHLFAQRGDLFLKIVLTNVHSPPYLHDALPIFLFDHSTFGHRRGIGRQRKRPGDGQPEWMQWELERSRFEHRKLAN